MKKKISKIQKISNELTNIQKQEKSLLVDLTFIQENYKEIENIRNKLAFIQRKILSLNDKYLKEISRCLKCQFYSIHDKTDIDKINQEYGIVN